MPNSRTFLFLDVEGVLTTRSSSDCGDAFDARCIDRLIHIIDETRCEVVLSSSFRLIPLLAASVWQALGREPGLCTPTNVIGNRGAEIAAFLAKHPGRRYAILDDDGDMLPEQQPFFVRTVSENGLTEVDARRVISVLL